MRLGTRVAPGRVTRVAKVARRSGPIAKSTAAAATARTATDRDPHSPPPAPPARRSRLPRVTRSGHAGGRISPSSSPRPGRGTVEPPTPFRGHPFIGDPRHELVHELERLLGAGDGSNQSPADQLARGRLHGRRVQPGDRCREVPSKDMTEHRAGIEKASRIGPEPGDAPADRLPEPARQRPVLGAGRQPGTIRRRRQQLLIHQRGYDLDRVERVAAARGVQQLGQPMACGGRHHQHRREQRLRVALAERRQAQPVQPARARDRLPLTDARGREEHAPAPAPPTARA